MAENRLREPGAAVELRGGASEALGYLDLPPGAKVGQYTIVKRVGAGGYAVTYLARNDIGRQLVLKFYRRGEGWDLSRGGGPRREVSRLMEIPAHPGIARPLEVLDWGRFDCLVLEYVEGKTLEERASRTRLSAHEALDLADQIGEALVHIGNSNIVHLDIKPSNVIIDPQSGRATLIDFGIAKRLEADGALDAGRGEPHTPGFASPEQIAGGKIDARSDICSSGLTLIWALTGFSNTSLSDFDGVRRYAEMALAGVDVPLRSLLLRMISTRPEGRPADAACLLREIAQCREMMNGFRLGDVLDGRRCIQRVDAGRLIAATAKAIDARGNGFVAEELDARGCWVWFPAQKVPGGRLTLDARMLLRRRIREWPEFQIELPPLAIEDHASPEEMAREAAKSEWGPSAGRPGPTRELAAFAFELVVGERPPCCPEDIDGEHVRRLGRGWVKLLRIALFDEGVHFASCVRFSDALLRASRGNLLPKLVRVCAVGAVLVGLCIGAVSLLDGGAKARIDFSPLPPAEPPRVRYRFLR